MDYKNFLQNLQTLYFDLYEKGLKKQANAALREFMLKFDTLTQEQKNELLGQMAFEIFESRTAQKWLERGNGELPYELNLCLREYLARETAANKMPQMRWYFELARDFDALKCAYSHPQCDERTIWLMFEWNLSFLDFWQHHFPDYCLASREDVEAAFDDCDAMLARHTSGINNEQKREFEYFKQLYELFWEWSAGDKSVELEDFCDERGLGFCEKRVYYYDK